MDIVYPGNLALHFNRRFVLLCSVSNLFHKGTTEASAADALADLFGGLGVGVGASSNTTAPASHDLASIVMAPTPPATYIPPSAVWLESSRGKGLEISGTFSVNPSTNQPQMELTLTNNALSPMTSFAIQFNKNSFGLAPAQPLNVPSPLQPQHSVKVTLPMGLGNQVVKMDPLMNLQVIILHHMNSIKIWNSVT